MPSALRTLDMNGNRITELPNPAAADDAVTREYVEARGTGLVTNGSGLMGDNYNFSSFTFDPVETHAGGGSFRINIAQQGRFSDELIPIDPEKAWRLIGWCKSGDTGGANFNAANRQYFGIAQLDIDGLAATPAHNQKIVGSTDTTLAVALNPGNTTITLADATGWYTGATAAMRHIAWWPYTNGKGYTWPDYTYTRNVSANDTWAAGAIAGNVITLNAPWAGPALAAGTKVRNATDGGSSGYKYIAAASAIVPNTWTRYEGYLSGLDTTYNGDTTKFQVGTAFVKLLFLVNYHGAADNNVRWSDMTLTDLSARNLDSAAVLPGSLTVPTTLAVSGNSDFNNNVRFHGTNAATYPWMAVVPPGSGNGAYLEWRRADNSRKAYFGYGADGPPGTLDLVMENGAHLAFSQILPVSVAAEKQAAVWGGGGGHTFTANVANQRAHLFNPPSAYLGDVPGRTISYAATVAIAGAPSAGTNMAITNAYGLWVMAGATRLDGVLDLSASAATAAALGTGIGDKIAFYSAAAAGYGLGVQANRLVAYLPSAAAFAVRQASAAGAASSGTDAWAAFPSGAMVSTMNAATYGWDLTQPSGGWIFRANRTDQNDYIRLSQISGSPYVASFSLSDDGTTWIAALGMQKDGRVGLGNWTSGSYPAQLSFLASTIAAGGIDFGGDTNLYRSAADTLATDDTLALNRVPLAGHYANMLAWGTRNFWRSSSGSTAESSFATWDTTDSRWEAVSTSAIIGPGVIETGYGNPTWKFRTAGIANRTAGDALTFVDALVIADSGKIGLGLTPTLGRLQLVAGTTAADGIYFGADANLYRAAADVLLTDDELRAAGAFRGMSAGAAFIANNPAQAFSAYGAVGITLLRNLLAGSDTQATFSILGSGRMDWGVGGATAPDTNLYRSAADTLKTDDSLVVAGASLDFLGSTVLRSLAAPSASTDLIRSQVLAESFNRLVVQADGRLTWGDGTAVGDTTLYRNSADMLATDDRFLIKRALAADVALSTQVGAFNGFYISAAGVLSWTDSAGGLTDTNLYRSAADQLSTDDNFVHNRPGFADSAAWFRVAGDAGYRLNIRADGRLDWGSGPGAGDTNLMRYLADKLKTDDNFIVALSAAIGQADISANQRLTVTSAVVDAAASQYGIRASLSNAHAAASAVGLYALMGELTITGTGGDTGIIVGLTGQTTYNASGSGSNINGTQSLVTHGAAGGGIGTARGGYNRIDNSHATNPIANALGLVIAQNIGAGPITNNVGLQVQGLSGTGSATGVDVGAMAGAGTNIGLQVAEPSAGAIRRAISLPSVSGLASGGLTFGADAELYRTVAHHLGLGAGDMLDLSVGGGTLAAVGTGIGDKIAMYAGTYGFGIQSNRLVAYVGSALSSVGFAVRPVAGAGNKSSGADAVALLGDGQVQAISMITARNGLAGAVSIGTDANGSIEMGRAQSDPGAQTPFIDFHYAQAGTWAGQDFNFRIINQADGGLNFQSLKQGGSILTVLQATAAGILFPQATAAGTALVIGGDTNLYRGGADILQTDDAVRVVRANGGDDAFVTRIGAGAFDKFEIDAAGDHAWHWSGAGTTSNLYEEASGVLHMDGELRIDTALKVKGADTGSRAFAMAVAA